MPLRYNPDTGEYEPFQIDNGGLSAANIPGYDPSTGIVAPTGPGNGLPPGFDNGGLSVSDVPGYNEQTGVVDYNQNAPNSPTYNPEQPSRYEPPAKPNGPAGSSGGDPGKAWLAYAGALGRRPTPDDVKAFIAQHPEYNASIGGSKGNKVTIGGRTYKFIEATSDPAKATPIYLDITDGEGGGDAGGNAIDPSYLAPFMGKFEGWKAPADFTFEDFKPPTGESILQDPSYKFRLDQTNGAIENSAAGRGLLNSTGTIHDILNNTGAFASQEFSNIYSRDLNTWGARRENAADAWSKNYGKSRDVNDQAWKQFQTEADLWYKNQDSPWSKLYSLANLGASASA